MEMVKKLGKNPWNKNLESILGRKTQTIKITHLNTKMKRTLFLNFVCLRNSNQLLNQIDSFYPYLCSLIKISFWQWSTISFSQLFLKLLNKFYAITKCY